MNWLGLLRALMTGAAVAAIGGAAPGCGPSAGGFCNKRCDCLSCSDTERGDCVDSVDDARSKSAGSGCSKEFDAYFSCVNGAMTCVEARLEVVGCEAEAEALSKCGGPVSLGGNACELLASTIEGKYAECGVELGGGVDVAECSGLQAEQAQCYTPCYADLECIVLVDPTTPEAAESAQRFTDCLSACPQ